MDITPTVDTAYTRHAPKLDYAAELPRLIASAIRRHCRRYRCLPDDRADLAQDAYIAACAANSSYDPAAGASHSTWITRRVQGQLLDSTRKMRSRGMTHLPLDSHFVAPIVDVAPDEDGSPAWEVADDGAGPEELLAIAEVRGQIGLLRKSMAPSEFALLALHYGLDGNERHSLRELAEQNGIAHQAVHQRLERLLRKAKGILQRLDRHPSSH